MILGCLLGGAVGDAIGLPHEGLTRRRIALRLGSRPIEHALIFRRGMLSDDTEHTCMTAQALLRAPDDPDAFMRSLAWRLRLWLLGLPASVGLGTLRALIRLWLGWSPARSGVGLQRSPEVTHPCYAKVTHPDLSDRVGGEADRSW